MGYDVYITRATYRWENENCKILEDTWDDYVKGDPSLRLGPDYMIGEKFVPLWTEHSSGEEIPIWFEDGNICTKNPDEATVEKLIEIARALDAQVQGDDGEVYSADRPDPYYPEPTTAERISNAFENLYWRVKQLFRRSQTGRDSLPYKVGDRVKDVYQREGTVVEMGYEADILPTVTVRFDNGQILKMSDYGSFLEPIESQVDTDSQT